jgi:hypothetical protein
MSRLILLVVILLTSGCGEREEDVVVLKLQVVDASGAPVVGAFVHGFFYQAQMEMKRDDGAYTGTTDAEGRVTLSGVENLYVKLKVTKHGYHPSFREVDVMPSVFNPEETQLVLLKEQRNPIPLHAKHTDFVREDLSDGQIYGYDLLAGDFVAPYGKGGTSDLVLAFTRQRTDTFNYSWSLDVSFANDEDGLIPVNFGLSDSTFVSDYEAPAEGYINQWTLHQSRAGVFSATVGNLDKTRSYYFRIRSSVDESGKIVGHYGKMYGELPAVVYYANPSSDDRNVEWDLQRNLLRSLRVPERPTAP